MCAGAGITYVGTSQARTDSLTGIIKIYGGSIMKKSRHMSERSRNLLLCMGFLLVLGPMSAFATVVNDFTAIVFGDDPFTGNNYFGTFSYDETELFGVGIETLDPFIGSVTVSFTFEGQTFDETNDSGFDAFPELEFSDGVPVYIDYILVDGSSGVDFIDPTVLEVSIQNDLVPDGFGDFSVDTFVAVQTIPVPAALPLFASGLGFLGWRLKKVA